MIRTLHPELLDSLPAQDVSAIHSRRDLRRLNMLMGHAPIITRSLQKLFLESPPSSIVEIGAGDGQLLLCVASRLHSQRWINLQGNRHPNSATQFLPLPGGEGRGEREGNNLSVTDILFIDQQNLISPKTKSQFATLNWNVRSVEADIFHWLKNSSAQTDVVLANLFLHHFTDAQLTLLFSELAEKSDAFIAVEPRRGPLPLFFSRLLGLIGCNAVTRHDAPVSVRAGFTSRELSALWPRSNQWEITERRAGLFSHLFVAQRKG